MQSLFVGYGAEGKGSGDVGCAIDILGTRVQKEETLGLEGGVGLNGGFVVHNGTVGPVASYGGKGVGYIVGLFASLFGKAAADVELGNAFVANGLVEPSGEADKGNGIAYVSLLHVLYFKGALDGLEGGNNASALYLYGLLGQGEYVARVGLIGVEEYAGASGYVAKVTLEVFVERYGYAIGLELFAGGSGEFVGVDVEVLLVGGDDHVGIEDGVEFHIGCAHVY